jgi:hypothetical protein
MRATTKPPTMSESWPAALSLGGDLGIGIGCTSTRAKFAIGFVPLWPSAIFILNECRRTREHPPHVGNTRDIPSRDVLIECRHRIEHPMHSMFWSASTFNQDISAWNVASVTDISGMFSSARAFNQDISPCTVASVTDTSRMF